MPKVYCFHSDSKDKVELIITRAKLEYALQALEEIYKTNDPCSVFTTVSEMRVKAYNGIRKSLQEFEVQRIGLKEEQ